MNKGNVCSVASMRPVFLSLIFVLIAIAVFYPSQASATDTCSQAYNGTFGSFNAPWYYGYFLPHTSTWYSLYSCAQKPVLVAQNLKPGEILKINEITGDICGRTFPRYGACVNDINQGCNDNEGYSCMDDLYVKVGFYNNSTRALVSEFPISSLINGVAVPSGAQSAYIYWKEYNPTYYFDNNGAYKCNFRASISNQQCGQCSSNSACGTDGYIGSQFCQNGSVFQNYTTYTCNNPGTSSSTCTNSTSPRLIQTCSGGQTCSNGQCQNITCSQNSDCGTNGFTGSAFCQNGSVYKNYTTYTCNNPGTSNSTCSNQTNPQLAIACLLNQVCSLGQCINIACSQNSDCGTSGVVGSPFCQNSNVYVNAKAYFCHNPGTVNSNCTNQTEAQLWQTCASGQTCSGGQCAAVTCSSNSDCGTSGFVGSPFCQNGSVFQNYTTYTCNNPGTSGSTCTNSTTAQLTQACGQNQTCSSGQCANVACSQNSDCGWDGYTGSNFCQNGSVYQNYITYTCSNAGTSSSVCTNSTSARLKQTCASGQTCSSGQCANVACSQNSDCGTNGFVGSPFCQSGNVYQDYKTYTCNNPGTANSTCTNSTSAQLTQTCSAGQTCANGSCAAIACSTNANCGTNGFVGDAFCAGGNIYKNYTTYTCNNPGTSNSTCSNSTTAQLFQACSTGQTCLTGMCVNVACNISSDCGANGFIGDPYCQSGDVYKVYKTYTCLNGGTANATCTNSLASQLLQDCTVGQTCSNGQCAAVVCSADANCGTNGFTGSPFCQSGNVYQDYKTYTCNNPGTANSTCTNSTSARLSQTCLSGQACSNGQCQNVSCNADVDCGTNGFVGSPFCQSGNIYQNYRTYVCNNPGTVNATCNNLTAAQLREVCLAGQPCSNGQCVNITCNADADCGTNGFVGSPFCQSGNVYQNYRTYVCNSPGTANSNCNALTTAQMKQVCLAGQPCSNGQCVNITCNADADCGTNGFVGSPFCQSGNVYQDYRAYVCNNPGTINAVCNNLTTAQLKQACIYGQACSNGSCSAVACTTNSDCGINGFVGSPFCQNGNVFQNYRTYTCNNPGTGSASCANSTNAQQTQTCGQNQTCANGQCQNVNITCSTNANCGTNGFVGDSFCIGGDVYQNYRTYTCQNPGTANSVCSDSTTYQLKQDCVQGQTCSGGACANVACSQNADCGTNGFTGSPFCQSGDVYQAYRTYTCSNPGTANSSCSNSSANQLVTDCTQNQTCASGQCQNLNIVCSQNSDCGTNGYVGSPFCQGNGVYRNYRGYVCHNPGTANSVCTDTLVPQIQQICNQNQTCANGACENLNIACYTNSQCGTNGFVGNLFCQNGNVYQNYLTYTCSNPGTSNAACSMSSTAQLKQTCATGQVCSSGSCVNITCSQNSDCGTDSYIGSPFCQSGNVYQNYRRYTCNNPGTANATCTNSTNSQLAQTCGQTQICSNGQCVQNDLNVSCYANPNPAGVNQPVSFISSVSGGTGSYAYNWASACVGNSTTCQASFPAVGNYFAHLTVTSGAQSITVSCPVTVTQTCVPHDRRACYGNKLYWYDSCGTRQEVAQDCGTGVCLNNQCFPFNFNVSCIARPNPTGINCPVTFSPYITINSSMEYVFSSPYIYLWSGACAGSQSTCVNSFTSTGTKTANLSVTINGLTKSAICTASITSGQCQ